MNARTAAAIPGGLCRFCGYPFTAEYEGQQYCSELCESTDRRIDEMEVRREERTDV